MVAGHTSSHGSERPRLQLALSPGPIARLSLPAKLSWLPASQSPGSRPAAPRSAWRWEAAHAQPCTWQEVLDNAAANGGPNTVGMVLPKQLVSSQPCMSGQAPLPLHREGLHPTHGAGQRWLCLPANPMFPFPCSCLSAVTPHPEVQEPAQPCSGWRLTAQAQVRQFTDAPKVRGPMAGNRRAPGS